MEIKVGDILKVQSCSTGYSKNNKRFLRIDVRLAQDKVTIFSANSELDIKVGDVVKVDEILSATHNLNKQGNRQFHNVHITAKISKAKNYGEDNSQYFQEVIDSTMEELSNYNFGD